MMTGQCLVLPSTYKYGSYLCSKEEYSLNILFFYTRLFPEDNKSVGGAKYLGSTVYLETYNIR